MNPLSKLYCTLTMLSAASTDGFLVIPLHLTGLPMPGQSPFNVFLDLDNKRHAPCQVTQCGPQGWWR